MQNDPTSGVRQNDLMDPVRAQTFQTTLGLALTLKAGAEVPPFFHTLYFWQAQPPQDLGRDGHPKIGQGLIPDLGLPRRMWAGGQLNFVTPLRLGQPAVQTTSLVSVTQKFGKTGPLAFVKLRMDIHQNDTLCLSEYRDLVYREDPQKNATHPKLVPARTDETVAQTECFDPTLLFRYSALTFNGHRIHYDISYARSIEGYAALVVHGPLLAQKLMLLVQSELGNLKTFSFRAVSPLMHDETATFCWHSDGTAWVRANDGRLCMSATAT